MISAFAKTTKEHQSRSEKSPVRFLESEIIGRSAVIRGPFGRRRLLYCDYTASGRALKFIEDFILEKVLPYYANTHTEASYTGKYISKLREEARDEVRSFANADDTYAVVFVGNGATGAINRLLHISGVNHRQDVVVLLGPYEHHATILPTITTSVEVAHIQLSENGSVDLKHLESVVKDCKQRGKQPVGIFSAVSNVTGVLTEVDAVTKLLHDFKGLCFWDYASGAPYLNIDVLRSDSAYSKDAVVFSPHKMVGGISTPGVLIAKKSLFVNEVPGAVGGGSVAYVTRTTHAFKKDIEEREESGTPNIIGSIRVGLILALRSEFLAHNEIEAIEEQLTNHVKRTLKSIPNLQVLGSTALRRLPTFSFVVRHPDLGLVLHHHFICTLLNDLFGIQTRSGCMCAGPYSQTLLSISDHDAESFLPFLETSHSDRKAQVEEIVKPGYIRLNFIYFLKNKDVEFILQALQFVAEHGWKFLPAYKSATSHIIGDVMLVLCSRFDARTGYWSFSHKATSSSWKRRDLNRKNRPIVKYKTRQHQCVSFAKKLAKKLNRKCFIEANVQGSESLSQEASEKKWFVLPSEAFSELGV